MRAVLYKAKALRDKGAELRDLARPKVEEMLTKLRALDSKESREKLSDKYRAERGRAIRTEAREALHDALAEWRTEARALQGERESALNFDNIARQARFTSRQLYDVSPESERIYRYPKDVLDRQNAAVIGDHIRTNLLIEQLEETRALRMQAVVSNASDRQLGALADTVRESGDLATAALLLDEAANRGINMHSGAKGRILGLRRSMKLPDEVTEAHQTFDEIDELARELQGVSAALANADDGELRTTDRVRQLRASREAGRDPLADAREAIAARETDRDAATVAAATKEVSNAAGAVA